MPASRIPLLLLAAACLLVANGCGAPAVSETERPTDSADDTTPASSDDARPPTTRPPVQQVEAPDAGSFASLDAAMEAMSEAAAAKDSNRMLAVGKWIAEQHGTEAIAGLEAIALDESATVEDRVAACGALKYIGPPAALALSQTVDAENSLVATNALKSLVMVRPAVPRLVDKLIAWVDHSNLQVQRAAIQSLARIGEKAGASAPKLQAILNDPSANETLRGEAKRALRAVDPRRTFVD